ncbi:craniofacial development protein 2-like [Phthorimaea operculella]|nr:craniofacial development protein 2-like [Phthorimaea operculella]
MNHEKTQRPLVPGDSSGARLDGMPTPAGVNRGAKNPRAASLNRQTNMARKLDSDHKLNILTYNVRTLSSEERLIELENALENINWDIVGLSEVRREGEECIERGTNVFYYSGVAGGQSGVGFLVSKRWINNIQEFIAYSDRIAVLKFRISETQILTVIQIYAPTTSHPDAEIEEFYDTLDKA